MLLEDIYEKYGADLDWQEIDADDFYLYLHGSREMFEALHEEGLLKTHAIWEAVRERCIRDLYFLSQFTFDSNPEGGVEADPSDNILTRESHQKIIDMFVVKDPNKSIANQSKSKTRLILYPRGGQKSTFGILDLIQWIFLDPAVRILFLAAADDLTSDTVREIKGFFTIKEARPTLMNMFWPEHCALEKDLKGEGQFTTPAWTSRQVERKEPTILSRGITSTVSGYHFEILHADDAISNRNSENEEQCLAVSKRYRLTRKTLRSFAYTNLIGTRYHEADLYGDLLAKNGTDKYPEAILTEFSVCCKKLTNPKTGFAALIGSAMTIKPEIERDLATKNVPRDRWFAEAGINGVELLLPKVLKYDDLLVEYNDGPEEFETQMRQNVLPPTRQKFDRPLLLKSTVSWVDLPVYGKRTQTWDLAGGRGKSENDNCVGSTCLWDAKGVGYIIDLVVENYPNPVAIAKGIVNFAVKHKPDILSIEDAQNARFLEDTIIREADLTGNESVKNLVRRIHWRQVDTQKDAKANRINSLHPLLVYGRMKFVNYLPHKEKMYAQFEKPVSKGSKNDIPDCISFQMIFQPAIQESDEIRQQREAEQKQFIQEERRKSQWYMLYEENNNPVYEYEKQEEEPQFFTPPPSDNDSVLGGFY